MDNKVLKKLAVDFLVEATTVCNKIENHEVFTNQLLRAISSAGASIHLLKYEKDAEEASIIAKTAFDEYASAEFYLEALLKIGAMGEETYRALYTKCSSLRKKLKDSQENM